MWREMRRKNAQLTQEECEEVLSAGKRGVLALLGDDGYPYTVPLDYTYAEGRFFFHGAVEGHKLDAVRAYDKCSFCVLSEPEHRGDNWWPTFKSIICFGRIHEIEDDDQKRAVLWDLAVKYFPTTEGEHEHIERVLNRVVILELKVEHMTGKLVDEK